MKLKQIEMEIQRFFYWIQFVPILMVHSLFSQIQQAPGPNFRKVVKALVWCSVGPDLGPNYL